MNKDEIKAIILRLQKENKYMNSRKIILCESEISILLDYITNLQEENKMYAQLKEEYEDIINKALDKLYCYGEVFDSKILQQFQKEMLNILEGSDKDETNS